MTDLEYGLRERKKRQTRAALAESALRLFAEKGYDSTTIADIAAAADVSTRTFFSYFRTKEEVVFADTDERLNRLREALAGVDPATPTIDVLRSVVGGMFASSAGIVGPNREVRAELTLNHPHLRAKALERMFAAQRELSTWLQHRHRPHLDEVTAASTSGALIGALVAATMASVARGDPPDVLRGEIVRVLDWLQATMPWSEGPST